MKTPTLLLITFVALFLATERTQAQVFFYKATALFPIQTEEPDPKNPGGTIIKKISLGSKQILNLALGRDANTKIDPHQHLLACRVDFNTPGLTKLVVVDPVALTVIATICELGAGTAASNTAQKDPSVSKGTGNGLAPGRILATVLGTPAVNGFDATDVCGSATAGQTPGHDGPSFKLAGTGIIGDVSGHINSEPLAGLIIKGMFTAGGKPL